LKELNHVAFHHNVGNGVLGQILGRENHLGYHFDWLLYFKPEHIGFPTSGQEFQLLHILVVEAFQSNVVFDGFTVCVVKRSPFIDFVEDLVLCGKRD
jgi:hypothetical protein